MTSNLEQAREKFFEGVEHFEAGRLQDARASFETALALAPDRASVLGNLGITLFHLSELEKAAPMLQRAVGADPDYAEAWTCLAYAQEGLRQWAAAVAAFERAIALSDVPAALWFRKGQCLLQLQRLPQALAAFESASDAAPGFADAWTARGGLLRDLGRLDEAATCYEKALECGGDRTLNEYYLAAVKGGGTTPAAPRAYVEALFDGYAEHFQQHLVNDLRYQGHERLLHPLIESNRWFDAGLDLGCGTGLCGQLLASRVGALDGVDLSQAMLDQARRLNVYRNLHHVDIAELLHSFDDRVDLVIAADVFIYVADLSAIFRDVRRILNSGGCFAFTVEIPTATQQVQLLPSLRYAHAESYIRTLADAAGFRVDRSLRAPLRVHQSQMLDGLYFHLS